MVHLATAHIVIYGTPLTLTHLDVTVNNAKTVSCRHGLDAIGEAVKKIALGVIFTLGAATCDLFGKISTWVARGTIHVRVCM